MRRERERRTIRGFKGFLVMADETTTNKGSIDEEIYLRGSREWYVTRQNMAGSEKGVRLGWGGVGGCVIVNLQSRETPPPHKKAKKHK